MNELISVIIPVYNVEKYLDRCIDSVVGQSYENLEIIIVNDGSTDESLEIIARRAAGDNRIKIVNKENGGLSDARNAGMALASGEYIAFVDSDDYIGNQMLEKLYEAIKRDKSDIAACSVKMVWEDSDKEQMLTGDFDCVLDRREAQRALLYEKELKQPVWYKLYRTSLIRDIPFAKGRYHEDNFWSYKAIDRAERVSIISYTGYFYSQRSDSIMGSCYSLKRLDAVDSYCERYDFMKDNYPELASYARLAVVNGCIYHGQLAMKFLSGDDKKKAMDYLKTTLKKYALEKNETKQLKTTHKIWLSAASISLKLCCAFRNLLRVGV